MRAMIVLLSLALLGGCLGEGAAPELAETQAELAHRGPRKNPGCDAPPCTHDLAYYREHPEAWLTPTLTLHHLTYEFAVLSCTTAECVVEEADLPLVHELAAAALNLQGLTGVETSVDALLIEASNILGNCYFGRGEACERERVPALTEGVRAFNEGRTSVLGELCGSAVGECRLGSIQCGDSGLACTGKLPLAAEICGNGLDDDCNAREDDECGCVHSVTYWRNHLDSIPSNTFHISGVDFEREDINCTAESCGVLDDAGWALVHELVAAFFNSPAEHTSVDPWLVEAAHYIKTCGFHEGPCDPSSVDSIREELRAFNEEVISIVGESCGATVCGSGTFQCDHGKLACDAPVPMAEIPANGVDDDCDGTLDEPLGKTIYLNGQGGSYKHGALDSSVNNLSYVVPVSGDVPAFSGGPEAWSQIMACVAQRFAPFDVLLTDVDPSPLPHVEAVVGGFPAAAGQWNGIGGIAARNCAPTGDAVVFIFSESYGNDVGEVCNTVAHELGHAYGLDHELLAPDLMSYAFVADKGFQDAVSECGESEARECMCGGFQQNSHAHLLARLSARNQPDGVPAPASRQRRALHVSVEARGAAREQNHESPADSEPPRLGEPLPGASDHYAGVCATPR